MGRALETHDSSHAATTSDAEHSWLAQARGRADKGVVPPEAIAIQPCRTPVRVDLASPGRFTTAWADST